MNMQISIYQFVKIIVLSRSGGKIILSINIAIFYLISTVNSNKFSNKGFQIIYLEINYLLTSDLLFFYSYPPFQSCLLPYSSFFKNYVDNFFHFSLPFSHLLVYNGLVIRDIQMYVSLCKVHLHLLLFAVGSFPVILKMYFCSSIKIYFSFFITFS